MRRADLVVGEEYAASTHRNSWDAAWQARSVRRVRVLDLGPFVAVGRAEGGKDVRIDIDGVQVYAAWFDRPESPRTTGGGRVHAVACVVLNHATGEPYAATMVDLREFRCPWAEYAAKHADRLAADRARIEERAAAAEAERAERARQEEAARVTAGLAARVGLRSGTTVAHHVYERPGQPWPEVDRRVLDALLAHAAETGWTWRP